MGIPGQEFSIPGHSQISLYYTFSIVPRWKNGRKIFPAKISKSTRSLGWDLLRMQTLLTSRWQSFWMAPPGWMIGAISRRNHWGIFPEVNCLKCVALTPPHAIYRRKMITIDSLVCFSSMILRFLADPPSTADEHIIWKTPKTTVGFYIYVCASICMSMIVPSICPIVAWGFIEP